MKALFVLLFTILITNKDTSRNFYLFDSYIEYKEKNTGNINFYLSNTKDNSYYLFGYDYGGENIKGSITDKISNYSHNFIVKNTLNAINFDYVYSALIVSHNYENNFFIEKKEEKLDSIKTKLTIYAYYKKKRKRYSRKIEIIFDNSNYKTQIDLISIFSHGTFIDKTIELPNGFPLEINVDYANGNFRNFILTKNKTINTQLNITK
jgi:hypothetical protein